MKKVLASLIIILFLGVIACGRGNDPGTIDVARFVDRMHDDEFNVTCWTHSSSGGIWCIPDWQLEEGIK